MLTMWAAMCFGKGADFPTALAGGLPGFEASAVAAVADEPGAVTGIEAELTDVVEAGAGTPAGTALAVLAAGATRGAAAPTTGAAGAAPVLAGVRGALLNAAV